MFRRQFLAALVALPALAVRAAAQGTDVSAINTYLRNLRAAEGRFRQTNPNGSVQTGRFFLSRPGRIRFEYDSPAGAMVIADGINVGVFDPKSNRGATRYLLSTTPLALLLRDDLSLAEPGLVRGATRDANGTAITMVDPRKPQEGQMVMTFSENPVALKSWVITTRAGQRTTVTLTEMNRSADLSRSLFNIELEETKLR
jgi:outer membrane lipoprotein-sorting protein